MTTNEINKQVLKIKKETLAIFEVAMKKEFEFANRERKDVLQSIFEDKTNDIKELEAKII